MKLSRLAPPIFYVVGIIQFGKLFEDHPQVVFSFLKKTYIG